MGWGILEDGWNAVKAAGKGAVSLGKGAISAAKEGAEAAFETGEGVVDGALKIGAGVTEIGDEIYEWGKDAYEYIDKIVKWAECIQWVENSTWWGAVAGIYILRSQKVIKNAGQCEKYAKAGGQVAELVGSSALPPSFVRCACKVAFAMPLPESATSAQAPPATAAPPTPLAIEVVSRSTDKLDVTAVALRWCSHYCGVGAG